jgi:hypothetical protein
MRKGEEKVREGKREGGRKGGVNLPLLGILFFKLP